MGIAGTAVSKEASAMVLLDDDFATVVGAVREGRKVYDNLRKFIRFAVATNGAEVLIVFLAPLLGLPMPLLPIQILWVNLVTDGLPSLALASEPAERDVMRRPPRPPREGVFARGLGRHVVGVAALIAALALGTEAGLVAAGSPGWQTAVFTVIALCQLANVLAIRSERDSLFTQGLRSNLPLAGAVALTLVLQAAVVYVPALNAVFHTRPLSVAEAILAVGVSSVVLAAGEVEKWLARARAR
jgi:Ca2+-transporting ATPase